MPTTISDIIALPATDNLFVIMDNYYVVYNGQTFLLIKGYEGSLLDLTIFKKYFFYTVSTVNIYVQDYVLIINGSSFVLGKVLVDYGTTVLCYINGYDTPQLKVKTDCKKVYLTNNINIVNRSNNILKMPLWLIKDYITNFNN